uniref:coiled-coil alpha-helical rod protein 1 isoform X2 n=1 Tax=Pristiophorus japonicus TaxID=55135 RepID=UPI00398EA651
MSERSRQGLGSGLEPPTAFSGQSGQEGLIPPSHFKGPPLVDADPWVALSKATKDILELRHENERLRDIQWTSNRDTFRGLTGSESGKACSRARSLDQERARLSREQSAQLAKRAEAVTEQSREIHRLAAAAGLLRSAAAQQAAAIGERDGLAACLSEQLGELRAELRERRLEASQLQLQHRARVEQLEAQHRAETQHLKAQLAQERAQAAQEAEQQRGELEELRERCRRELSALQEEAAKQAEAMSSDSCLQMARIQDAQQRTAELLHSAESQDKDRAALRQTVAGLEQELRQSREKGRCEVAHLRERLEVVGQERDTLQQELSKTTCELESQSCLIQQLRTYIGQLVPDERQLEESQQEKEQLSNRVQHLEKERETLRATVELLNVRLASLTDILTIQENDCSGKVQSDTQDGDSGKRPSLVTRWREKVFALMVQLKSQEISHVNDINHLQLKIASLGEELRVKGQQQAVLLHSLEDRTAEMNMERMQNRTLREELAGAQNDAERLREKAERAENTLCCLKEVVSSVYQKFLDQEAELKKALCRLVNLAQRVTFANKRIDTVHGLLARKDALVRLQLQEKSGETGPDVGRRSYEDLEKELELLNGERDQLAAELKRNSQLIEKKVTEARLKFDADLKDCLAVVEQLEEALEEKTRCQLRLTEQLNEAQQQLGDTREAAETLRAELCQQQEKYEQVVTLRQTDRQAARDKERMQACAKLQDEQHQWEIQRLSKRLRELERDKNLLVATLRQEGLLSQFRKSRAAAVHSTAALSDEEELARPLPHSQASKVRSKAYSKDSLAEVLDELQTLSAAVIEDQEERDTTEEEETE